MSVPDDETAAAAPHDRDPLKRKIALTLAAFVVLGAGIAILQTDASVKESNSARETTRVAVRAMRANVVAETATDLAPELRAERDFLPFRPPFSSGSSLAAAASLRGAERAVPDLGIDKSLGALEFEAQRETLKQRAMATTRIAWNDRSTQYTTVIAVLAVALFLVGFGLIVEGPIRRSSYGLGVALGLFVAGWAVWIYQLPIPSTPDAAIRAVARGGALTASGDYRAALTEYDRALRADGSYAAAYEGRSRARLLVANPDYPTTRAFTDVRGRATAAAVADARRGLALGGGRNILGFGLVALTAFYRGEYEQAMAAADDASAVNPQVPDLWLLRSAALVALGERPAANAALGRALALVRDDEPSQRTRLLSSTYLSYLAWVQRHEPARARAARELSDRAVSAETAFTLGRRLPATPPASGAVSVRGLRFAHGKLTLRLRWTGLPKGTALSAVGYERPLARGAWTQPADLALFATVGGSGEREIVVPLRRVCAPTAVRMDVFLDGARTLSRTGPGVAPTC